jgi:RHS repeat-associated protein
VSSRDAAARVQYRYGAAGKRAVKYNEKTGGEALYFNAMWDLAQMNGDHLGSAQMVTNWEGKIYERYEYTPYGEARIERENRNVQRNEKLPYRFTGKELDEETGLYYYGARYLDPRAGRWLSADPAAGEYVPAAAAGRKGGDLPGTGGVYNAVNLHLYHYAGNNPVKHKDPDGKTPGNSIYGFSMDPQGAFNNFWGSLLGNLSAFLGNKNAQQNLTDSGQYYLQEFDTFNIAVLNTTSEAASNASLFFLAIGQPEAAAATSAIALTAESLLVAHDLVDGLRNGDNRAISTVINKGTFVVAGVIIGKGVSNATNKILSISTDRKTMSYTLNNKWNTLSQKIRNDFGDMSGEAVSRILNEAKKVYDAAQE